MSYWQGPYRWINIVLLTILSALTVDGILRLFGARPENVIVRTVRALANPLRAPFDGMFAGQSGALTFVLAVLGYVAVALVTFAVLRTLEVNRRRPSGEEHPRVEGPS
jgi:hypothetical protein